MKKYVFLSLLPFLSTTLTGCEVNFENEIVNTISAYQTYSLIMCSASEYFNSPPNLSTREDSLASYTSYFKNFLNSGEISYILTTDTTYSNKLIVSSGDYACVMLFNEQSNGKNVSTDEKQVLSSCSLDGIIHDDHNNQLYIHAIHNVEKVAHLFNYTITRKIVAVISKDSTVNLDNYSKNDENSIKIEENLDDLVYDFGLSASITPAPFSVNLKIEDDDYNISKISTNNYKISSTNLLSYSKKLSYFGRIYSFSDYA